MHGLAPRPRRAFAPDRRLTSLLAVVAVVAALLVPNLTAGSPAAAAEPNTAALTSATPVDAGVAPMTLDGFDAGNIISDEVFFNKGTMSAAQIDSFFKSKVSSCQPGYTCLKDFRMNTPTRPADKYCNGYTGGQGESAATIIYKASQSCGINPQVFIVMLQKEQGLITHTWPSQWRFDMALGQGCPDDAPCDPQFAGFFYQIYGAARQMKIYTEGYWFQWFAPGNTWNIQYHPNKGCGTAPVYVANAATSALYYYTPYQPNAAAMRAGYGEGDACSSYGNRNFYNYFTDWFGPTGGSSVEKNSPFGNVELIEARPGEFAVVGWAIDPNTAAPISIHVYAGSAGKAVTADLARADVGAAYPAAGSKHGFSTTIPVNGAGENNICVYAINAGPGANVLLACKSVLALTGAPVGKIDSVKAVGNSIEVSGWALDPDTKDPISAHVYVGAAGYAVTADAAHSGIPAEYKSNGPNHGFKKTIPVSAGTHTVCVYGINVGPGANSSLGCKDVTVGSSIEEKGRAPIGALESVTVDGLTATASGWTLDPDTASSIRVHLYVGAMGKEFMADKVRIDVGAANPGYGNAHGFAESLSLPAGKSTVCAYGINTGAGGHTLLGCKEVTASAIQEKGRAPIGSLESVKVDGTTAVATGWTIDPDTAASIRVHLYVGATGKEFIADKARADVGAANPGYGNAHGFSETLNLPAGKSTVCAYGINTGAGGHSLLGCKEVTASAIQEKGRAPIGSLESVKVDGTTAVVTGWTIDPDTASSIRVHLYVGATGKEFIADKARADVGAANPGYGDAHGFSESMNLPAGKSTVCAYGINTGAGGHSLLGCKEVTASAIQEKGRAPIGSLESVKVDGTTAVATGWTIDPDTASSIRVHLYVGATGKEFIADKARADVGAANPGYGDAHGFSETLNLPAGKSTVCAYGINTGAGGHSLLGCKEVTAVAPSADLGRVPFGNLEGVSVEPGAVNVSGWVIDPDTTGPVSVHIYVGAAGSAHWADVPRADVGAAYPAYGDDHGFGARVAVAPGTYTVCVYAINNGSGGNVVLGCAPVAVP